MAPEELRDEGLTGVLDEKTLERREIQKPELVEQKNEVSAAKAASRAADVAFAKKLESPEFLGKMWDEVVVPQHDEISPFKLEVFGLPPRQAELLIARLLAIEAIEAPSFLSKNQYYSSNDRPKSEAPDKKLKFSQIYKIKKQYVGKSWAQLYGEAEKSAAPVKPEVAQSVTPKPKEPSLMQRARRLFGGLFARTVRLEADPNALPVLEPTVLIKERQKPVAAPRETPVVGPIAEAEPITAEIPVATSEAPTQEMPVMNAAEVVAAATQAANEGSEKEAAIVRERVLAADAMKDPHVVAALEFNGELVNLIDEIDAKKINNPEAAYVFLRERLGDEKVQNIIQRMNPRAFDNILFNSIKERNRPDNDKPISEAARAGIALYLNRVRNFSITANQARSYVRYVRPVKTEQSS